MSNTEDAIAAFLAKGGKIRKCEPLPADTEPQKPGQYRALREKRGMDTNWAWSGKP